jgi:hypothetical protein
MIEVRIIKANFLGKIVWWDTFNTIVNGVDTTVGGDVNVCHPFCNGECYFPFNWRYCAGTTCRASVLGDPITAPVTVPGGHEPRQIGPPRDVVRSLPPQCTPDNWDNGG